MNTVKYYLELCLVPLYFVMLLAVNIKDAVVETLNEVKWAVWDTRRKYGRVPRKPTPLPKVADFNDL